MSTFTYHKPGIGNAASYQTAGIPWYTSSFAPALSTTSVVVNLPQVTKFITIKNTSTTGDSLRFTLNNDSVVDNTNYIILESGESFSADLRVTDIHLISDTETPVPFTIVNGLTNIRRQEMTSTTPVPPNLLAWVQKQKLIADDPVSPEGDFFGGYLDYATSENGNRLIIGAIADEGVLGEEIAGSVYVLEEVDGQYIQTEKIYQPGGSQLYGFFGDVIFTNKDASRFATRGYIPQQTIYIYESGSSGYTSIQQIVAETSSTQFGSKTLFSADNDKLFIASQYDNTYFQNNGAVYFYQTSSLGYQYSQYITASYNTDGSPDGVAQVDNFGSDIFISKDANTLFASSPGDDEAGTNAGAVYVFQSSSLGYEQVQKITASYDAIAHPQIGFASIGNRISCTEDLSLLAVGAEGFDVSGQEDAGAVFIFESGSTGYQQTEILTASGDADPSFDNFGNNVTLSEDGTLLFVTAGNDEEKGGGNGSLSGAGSVYVFNRTENGFKQVQKLTATYRSDGTPEGDLSTGGYAEYLGGQQFGRPCLSKDNQTLIIGAGSDKEQGYSDFFGQSLGAGAVYVFKYTRDY